MEEREALYTVDLRHQNGRRYRVTVSALNPREAETRAENSLAGGGWESEGVRAYAEPALEAELDRVSKNYSQAIAECDRLRSLVALIGEAAKLGEPGAALAELIEARAKLREESELLEKAASLASLYHGSGAGCHRSPECFWCRLVDDRLTPVHPGEAQEAR